MRNDVTIVSALFNIERERMDGRDWEEYLKWFDVTLQLKCPMVLFITEDVKELVESRRKNLPTEIIVQEVDDIPYYHLKDEIQEILDSGEYKDPRWQILLGLNVNMLCILLFNTLSSLG